EPVAELTREALGDHVRRVPLLPIVLVVAVVERAHGDDASIQPGVADVLHALHARAAAAAFDLDAIQIRTMWRMAFEFLVTGDSALLELVFTANHLEVAA